jgi:hypothetical protein
MSEEWVKRYGTQERGVLMYVLSELEREKLIEIIVTTTKADIDRTIEKATTPASLLETNEVKRDRALSRFGYSVQSIAIHCKWFIKDKYDKDGYRLIDIRKAKKIISELAEEGYVIVKKANKAYQPHRYITASTYQAIYN